VTAARTVADRRAPGPALYLTDYARSLGEFGSLSLAWPLLARAPSGDGQTVLVLPGLAGSDGSTVVLRNVLRRLGYQPHGWGLGRNIGPTAQIVSGMRTRIDELAETQGAPVSVIGWSLGGIFARQLARRSPDSVRQVITLGSPIRLERRRQSNARRVFDRYSHLHVETWDLPLEGGLGPLPVPATSIYSRLDGVVAWQACLDEVSERAENIEVYASHLGMAHHPTVLWAVADRLAQGAGAWAPFRAPAWLRLGYPRPVDRASWIT
jgi:pimeloyl-ACP methyl ester carboxylesterase